MVTLPELVKATELSGFVRSPEGLLGSQLGPAEQGQLHQEVGTAGLPAVGPSHALASPTEGLHRLCYQCQAADQAHAPEQAELPVPNVAVRGVPAL